MCRECFLDSNKAVLILFEIFFVVVLIPVIKLYYSFRMYIQHLLVRDLVNYKGTNMIHFRDGFCEGIPNDLYAFIGENNTGKSSILQLIRACTDLAYLCEEKDGRKNWQKINVYDKKKPEGIVFCHMVSKNKGRYVAGFYKKGNPDEQQSGVYFSGKLAPAEGELRNVS